MLLLVLHTAEVQKKSLNTSFLIKYNEKCVGHSGGKWRKKLTLTLSKAENKQTRTMILSTHFVSTSQWVNNIEHKNFCAL